MTVVSDPSPWALERVGVVVGERYRIERLIGEGAMGAVFAARHVTLGKLVAIKMMPPEDKFEVEAARRFEQEAVAAASIARKGVVEVLDFGVDRKVGPYIVMEMLEGESLEAKIRREKTLSPATTIALLTPVLDALSSVHARSIVHRDLKPANLFVSRDQEGEEVVKILDFGVSRVRQGKRALMTATGVVVGTPRFMAPEQARGVEDLDLRADIYAIGAIAYSCLAGKPPYADKGHIDVLAAILTEPPTPLAELVSTVPPRLLEVIEKAMAREREARFVNASEMRTAMLMAAQASNVAVSSAGATMAGRPSATVDLPLAKNGEFPGTRIAAPVNVTLGIALPEPGPLDHPPAHVQAAPTTGVPPSALAAPGSPPTAEYAQQISMLAAPLAAAPLVSGLAQAPPAYVAPAASAVPVRATRVPTEPKKGGRGWIVAIALLVALFCGFAAFTVWWWTSDEEIEGAS